MNTTLSDHRGIPPSSHRNELGNFLRSRRERTHPESLGIARKERRRTPGLRREEVAEAAGISVDWYIRLEQGRDVNPSRKTVESIASALNLTQGERSHLYLLTGTAERVDKGAETVSKSFARMVDGLKVPAYVTGVRWDVLHWNQAADALFRFGGRRLEERNVLIGMFLFPDIRKLFGKTWESEARRMIAEFRVVFDLYAADERFQEVVTRLNAESATFAKWWTLHNVQTGGSGSKTLFPAGGKAVKFDYHALRPVENSTLKLVVYSPVAGSD